MDTNFLVYTLYCDNEFKQDSSVLQSRWNTEKIWRNFRQDLLSALYNKDNKKLQDVLSRKGFLMKALSGLVYEKKFDLVDLRGIELKNLELIDYDLSYCCFDYAKLNDLVFNKTNLQYSSFNQSTLKKIKFIEVQASPICAINTKFEEVEFEQGLFMHSDFSGATFLGCNVSGKNIPNSEYSLFSNVKM